MTPKGKKKLAFPHTYLILLILCIIMIVLTNLLPAGEFDRAVDDSGRTVVVAGTYHPVDPSPGSILELPVKLQSGMKAGAEILVFMLLMGGSLGIINEAGAVNFFLCQVLPQKLRGRESLFIPVLMVIMALGGLTFGMNVEAVAFLPAVVALSIALGYDSLLAVGIVFLGSNIGYTAGIYNPYNVGVAQSLAELPLYSGAWYRWILLIALLSVTTLFLMGYARRVKADPTQSLVADLAPAQGGTAADPAVSPKASLRQWLGMLAFLLGFAAIIFGSTRLNWWIPEIGAVFFWVAVVTGIIFRFSPNQVCTLFGKGAQEIVGGALAVGFAYSISTILNEGHVMDSLVNFLSISLNMVPSFLQAGGMMAAQTIINLGIPAGSAQAAATMPIIIPLADILGISRQAAVFAFQCGDGISNALIPTYTTLITLLSLAKVPYERWFKFACKIVLLQWLIGFVMSVLTVPAGL